MVNPHHTVDSANLLESIHEPMDTHGQPGNPPTVASSALALAPGSSGFLLSGTGQNLDM